MNKKELLDKLIRHLEKTLEVTRNAAKDAREAAINEESKPEDEYDTRGLEASYLAGAQAKRADELLHSINLLKEVDIKRAPLVTAEIDGKQKRTFFILHYAGGVKIETGGNEVVVITPDSPIGKMLIGKKAGDSFEFSAGAASHEYEIVEVQ